MLICAVPSCPVPEEPALLYLKRMGRQRGWADQTDEFLSRLLVDVFLGADVAETVALLDEADHTDEVARDTALKTLLQWRVCKWTADQNRKGVTPPTALVLDQFEMQRLAMPVAARPASLGTSACSAARKAMSRWRLRFGGRIGRLTLREEIPLDVMRSKATAVWQWCNYLRSKVPANKIPLLINFDETAICLFQGHGRGNVFVAKGRAAAQNISRRETRTHLTHVAFVCDAAEVQAVMPQIIIANERTILARDFVALRAACPANVVLVRAKSSWNNVTLCGRIIRVLARTLAPYIEYQPILFFDAASQHLGPPVWAACAATSIWPILVPAKMTGVLQMLDTHGFAIFKIHIQRSYQAARIATADGQVGIAELIASIRTAIREVLEGRSWAHAFVGNGFGAEQIGISRRVLDELQFEAPLSISAAKPTLTQLQACFPQRLRAPVASAWRSLNAPACGCVTLGAYSSTSASSALSSPVVAASDTVLPAFQIPLNTRSRARAASSSVGVAG